MALVIKTIKQKLEYRSGVSEWFTTTRELYNIVAAFYFGVIEAYPEVLELPSHQARARLEQLTHSTKTNPNPPAPLAAVAINVPAVFRRAAISDAFGLAQAFHANLARWHKEKEAFEAKIQIKAARNQSTHTKKRQGKNKRRTKTTTALKFTKRPPVPPRKWNLPPTFCKEMYWDRTDTSILLKLWNGASWVWCKFAISPRDLPQEWELCSPHIVQHGKRDWRLHTPIEKKFTSPGKVEKQFKANNTNLRICSVDLNLGENIAVCTILTAEGTVVATKFIKGGRYLHGFRKRLLGKIAIKMRKTGLIAKGESFYRKGWERVSNLNDNAAHLVSRRIVNFARAHEADVVVFEHLTNLKPDKGRYSKRANQRRAHWLKGKIFQFSSYKAWAEGILTCRVSPRNTSKECHRCHALPLARYSEGQEPVGYAIGAPLVYCPNCGMRGNADRNAAIVIGQRLLARFSQAGTNPSRASGRGKGKKDSLTQAAQTDSALIS